MRPPIGGTYGSPALRSFLTQTSWTTPPVTIVMGAVALATVITSWLEPITLGQDLRPQPGSWTTLAPAPTKRTEVAAAALGGKIYVVGGFNEPGLGNLTRLAVSDALEEYDPAANRWATRAPLPKGLHHAAAATVGNRLYVIGGFTASLFSLWQPLASVYLYQPETDAWIERAPMPTPRGALAVAEYEGKLFAIGGYDGDGNSAAVEVYDPGSNSWSARSPLPTPRDHLAAAAVGQRLYAIGGRLNRDYSRNLAVTESYDPAADRWTRVADLPTPRSGITAGVIRSKIYVLGGEAPEGTFRTNEVYSPDTDRWETQAPMPTGRHGLGSAVVNDRLYVIGGGPTPGGSFSNVHEQYSPASGPAAGPTGMRASAKHVGAVMSMLAVFQDAQALPRENSQEANQLIKALIQFQAAFIKSTQPGVRRWFTEALTAGLGDRAPAALEAFPNEGWTSQSLEAIVDYAAGHPIWGQPGIAESFRAYNLEQSDFDLVARTFRTARSRLAERGGDLHAVYALRRSEMPGANHNPER
ncbi:MAG: Kelch repeat-containing protein [Nitrospiraceae bacterium]